MKRRIRMTEFLPMVKNSLPQVDDEAIMDFFVKNQGIESVDEFVKAFKEAHNPQKTNPTNELAKAVLEKTLELNEYDLFVFYNLFLRASQGKGANLLITIDDYGTSLVGDDDAVTSLGKKVLENPDLRFIEFVSKDKAELLTLDQLKCKIARLWGIIFPHVMSMPNVFQDFGDEKVSCVFYDDIVSPLLCKYLGIKYVASDN